jgi:hypothetical protein
MSDNAQELQGMQFNFNNVESAEGYNNTEPGTIAVFKISNAEFVKSKDKGTPGLKCTFEQTGSNTLADEKEAKRGIGSTFPHSFWLTANALPRIQHLAEHALKQKLSGDLTGPNLVAMFKGKELPLKVTAQIDERSGRVYANLPFGGFSAENISDLKLSSAEQAEIAKSKSVVAKTNVATADIEDDGIDTSATVGTQSEAEEF